MADVFNEEYGMDEKKQYEFLNDEIFRMFSDNCLESIIIFDNSGTIIDANEIAWKETGYGNGIIGKNICSLYPNVFNITSSGITIMDKNVKEDKNDEPGFPAITYCKNMTCFPVRMKVVFKTRDDIFFGIIMTKNVTIQNAAIRRELAAHAEVETTAKLKSEFVANITHELRTPVNGIRGLAENLINTPLTYEQRDNINIMINCCNNMSSIINDLLDFSKLEAGKMTIEKRKFNLYEFVNNTMNFNSKRISDKGLKLLVNVGSDVPEYVVGDELRLGQIINNLLSNAIKFTQVGHIAFDMGVTEKSSDHCELFFMIIDTGIGIAKDKIDNLFQSFTQVDGSITRRFGGTGLGLAITKNLVELMGGSIHVNSEPDKGSNFSFSIVVGLPGDQAIADSSDGESGIQKTQPVLSALISKNENKKKLVAFDEIRKPVCEALEKLIICVELGTWDKAEDFAGVVHAQLANTDNSEYTRKAFRLELDTRKSNYSKVIVQAKELLTLVKKYSISE